MTAGLFVANLNGLFWRVRSVVVGGFSAVQKNPIIQQKEVTFDALQLALNLSKLNLIFLHPPLLFNDFPFSQTFFCSSFEISRLAEQATESGVYCMQITVCCNRFTQQQRTARLHCKNPSRWGILFRLFFSSSSESWKRAVALKNWKFFQDQHLALSIS